MKVEIHVSTESVEEGRRVLRGLEALLSSGAQVSYGIMQPEMPAGLASSLAQPMTEQMARAEQEAAVAAGPPTQSGEQPRRGRKPRAETAPAPEPTAPAAEPATDPAPEPEAAAEEAEDIQPEPPVDETPVTEEDIRKALNKLAGLIGVPGAMAVLEQSGHKKVKDVPESKRANLKLLLDSAIGKAEAERKAKAT